VKKIIVPSTTKAVTAAVVASQKGNKMGDNGDNSKTSVVAKVTLEKSFEDNNMSKKVRDEEKNPKVSKRVHGTLIIKGGYTMSE
jgi:hypothetical protein